MKQALEGHAGVTAVTMRFDDKQYDVTFDAAKTNPGALVATVKEAGFEASAK
ncbi:MAG: heavy-metal-associated domain-containing protein [Planctomycetota bacterium]